MTMAAAPLAQHCNSAFQFFQRRFGVDTRTLEVFRISLALAFIMNLLPKWRNVEGWYTDDGIWPRRSALQHYSCNELNLFFTVSSAAACSVLFAINLIALVMMLVGWHTRVATVSAACLCLSLTTDSVHLLHHESNASLTIRGHELRR